MKSQIQSPESNVLGMAATFSFTGVLECWSIGVWAGPVPTEPILHHSTTPSLHHPISG